MWIGVFVNIVDTIKWISDTIYKDTLNPGDTSNEFILKSDELYRIGEFGFDTLYNTFGSPFYSSVWTVAPFWPKMNDSTNYEYSVYYDKIVLRQFNK